MDDITLQCGKSVWQPLLMETPSVIYLVILNHPLVILKLSSFVQKMSVKYI